MNSKEILKKLNNASDLLVNSLQQKRYIGFYEGDTYKTLKNVISEIAPLSKVGIIYGENDFALLGAKITKTVKSINSKPLNVVINKKDFDLIKGEKLINALNEDTRALITTEPEFFPLLSVMAKRRNIPAVLIMRAVYGGQVLPVEYTIGKECYKLDGDRRIILDFNEICKNDDRAVPYAFCFKYLPALTDYRFKIFSNMVTANEHAYGLVSESLTELFKIFRLANKDQIICALKASLIFQLSNIATDGELFDKSSVAVVESLIEKDVSAGESLLIAKTVMGIYSLYCSGEYNDVLETPDYNARADELNKITGKNDGIYLDNFENQLKILKKEKSKCSKFVKSIGQEISSQSEIYKVVLKTFVALKGRIESDNDFCKEIKLAGDLFAVPNFMSLIRESGITEYLTV